jgi:hypothetical protein
MRIMAVHSRVSPLLMAVVLVLQLSPALATGHPDAQHARRHGPVEVTFTKWRTVLVPAPPAVPPPGATTRILFEGLVGGDLGDGDFVGEVVDRKASTACTAVDPACSPGTPPTITTPIAALHAIYEVQVGEHSFTALIQGGSNSVTGVGLLNGVILAGWRTGARVHVAFQTMTNCADAPAGPCFQGVIRVERAPRE